MFRRHIAFLGLLILSSCADPSDSSKTADSEAVRFQGPLILYVAEARDVVIDLDRMSLSGISPSVTEFVYPPTEIPEELAWNTFIEQWALADKPTPRKGILTGMSALNKSLECNIQFDLTQVPSLGTKTDQANFETLVTRMWPDDNPEVCGTLEHVCIYLDPVKMNVLPSRDDHFCNWCCPEQVGWDSGMPGIQ